MTDRLNITAYQEEDAKMVDQILATYGLTCRMAQIHHNIWSCYVSLEERMLERLEKRLGKTKFTIPVNTRMI